MLIIKSHTITNCPQREREFFNYICVFFWGATLSLIAAQFNANCRRMSAIYKKTHARQIIHLKSEWDRSWCFDCQTNWWEIYIRLYRVQSREYDELWALVPTIDVANPQPHNESAQKQLSRAACYFFSWAVCAAIDSSHTHTHRHWQRQRQRQQRQACAHTGRTLSWMPA